MFVYLRNKFFMIKKTIYCLYWPIINICQCMDKKFEKIPQNKAGEMYKKNLKDQKAFGR